MVLRTTKGRSIMDRPFCCSSYVLRLFARVLLGFFFKFSFGHVFENVEVFVFGVIAREFVNQFAIGFEKQCGWKTRDTISGNGFGIGEIVFKNFDTVFFIFGIEFYWNEIFGQVGLYIGF